MSQILCQICQNEGNLKCDFPKCSLTFCEKCAMKGKSENIHFCHPHYEIAKANFESNLNPNLKLHPITDKKNNRAKSIAAMGLVRKEGHTYKVSTPSLKGQQATYTISRNEQGKIICDCIEFESEIEENPEFQCEHYLAVKYYLQEQNK